MRIKRIKTEFGFTIIETMIAVSVFLVVVLYGMNALLSADMFSGKSAAMRSVLDNLSFAMEDMGRNLRTGSDYHCITDGNTLATGALSCVAGGQGISFLASTGARWVYFMAANPDGTLYLEKSTDGGTTFIVLTTPEIKLDASSGFFVIGAEPPPGDQNQPLIKIWLNGKISEKGVDIPFALETSVSQRIVDINTIP